MNTAAAFEMGERTKHDRPMVFDWNRAAHLIKERNPQIVSAGLHSDWEWTGGEIFKKGKPVTDSYTYLASTWSKPEIDIDGEVEDCWTWMDETTWTQKTKWPQSALDILLT